MAFTDRSLPARSAILDAARVEFAANGFDRATVRAIAARARVDPSMIVRYFDTKRGLFAAATEFDLRLPELAATPRDDVGRVLAAHLLERWEDDEALKILLRSAATDDEAADTMRGILADQLVPLLRSLGNSRSSATTRAGLVATQALGLALCRYVLQLPPIASMRPDALADWIAPALQRYLVD